MLGLVWSQCCRCVRIGISTSDHPVCSVADGRREAHDPVIGCRYLDTYASTALAPHQSKHQLDEAVLRHSRIFARYCVLIARSALLRCQSTFAGTTRREAHDPVIGCRYLDTDASTALAPHQSKHQLDETVLRQPWRFARRCVLIARSALLLCQMPSRRRAAGMQS